MRRMLLALWIMIAPACLLLATTTGCQDEVKSVKKSERTEESEPQMTSPGQEVLE